MIQAATSVDIRTSMPNDAQTRMMTSRMRSSLSDAQRSKALKMPVTLLFTVPDPKQAALSSTGLITEGGSGGCILLHVSDL
jgi:hypothetical protein